MYMREITRKDLKKIVNWASSEEELMTWAGSSFSYPLKIDELKAYIKGANGIGSDRYIFVLVQDEEVVGHISLAHIDYQNHSGRIGRVVVEENSRGKGYGTLMMKHMLQIGFEELNLNRISLGVYDFNVSAYKTYEKLGFVQEGILREKLKTTNGYWNSIEMSMLSKEWKQRNGLIKK
ncbi:GNAT family N-acetyltransferase [Priestia endophytica]|uniref:GNAT family N-acetyltransferase n=2 Tax=Priestia endophytica TaxID=135735 RepID=A0AAX1QHV2_9BACI|nr:GNAT family N-acetyltransferase [Priestia endophytica]RAS84593.1 GNAT family N-acetyltransferase [Priestia endophytica]